MAERRTIGQILMSFGRITEDDVAKALEYQQENGGYFGEALLALGYVSAEELEWGLAAQFDLPYVFPEADSIDPEAACLVSAEWALTHLTLPIMRTADALTVVVDSPLKTDAVDQLQARTDRKIEIALAPAGKIRELIRQVYGIDEADGEGERAATTLEEVFGRALEAGAERFGVSVRGPWAHGWYEERGTVRRVALRGGWANALNEHLTPSPRESVGDAGRATWKAQLDREGVASAVTVDYLAGPAGVEYLLRPERTHASLLARFTPPPPDVKSEVRLLAQSGAARFVVTGKPGSLVARFLPYFPALLFDGSRRSVHLCPPGDSMPDDVFTVALDTSDASWPGALEDVRDFHFDVATAHLTGEPRIWIPKVVGIAGATFAAWPDLGDRRAAQEAGLRWEIHLESPADGHVEWSLRPLRS